MENLPYFVSSVPRTPAFDKYSINWVFEAIRIFCVCVSLSFCKSSSWSLSSPDDKLSANIWWSLTSYSGDKCKCYHAEQTNEQQDSATQFMDTECWVSQMVHNSFIQSHHPSTGSDDLAVATDLWSHEDQENSSPSCAHSGNPGLCAFVYLWLCSFFQWSRIWPWWRLNITWLRLKTSLKMVWVICLSSSKIFLNLDRTSGVVSNLTFIWVQIFRWFI